MNGFVATHPAAFWGLLLAVPIVLLHLYHRRRVVVVFLPLLKEAVGARRPGGGWRRLRDRMALGLRLLALLAAVLALAGLVPRPDAPEPPALVLVIDADVTTDAREAGGETRSARARAAATAWLGAGPWREVAVLEARETPHVLVPPTRDVEGARRTLRQPGAPADTEADVGAATDQALRLASSIAPARVLVLSARAFDASVPAPEGVGLEVLGVGSVRDDRAIVAFDVRSQEEAPSSSVEVGVRNDAAGARSTTVVLRVGGTEQQRRSVDLAPGEVAMVTFEITPPREGAWIDLDLEGGDAYAANDHVGAWLAPPVRPAVLAVHGGRLRPYVRALLEAMGETIDAEASGTVAARDLPVATLRDVMLVDGVDLPPRSLRPGAWIFLAPRGGELPFDLGDAVDEPMIWRTSPDHPLVRDIDLAAAYVARGRPLRGEGLVALAEADGQAMLAEGEADGVRYVALGLDPEGSDLPLRTALPLLLRNAIRRLAFAPARPFKPFYRSGERLRPRRPLPGGPDAVLSCGVRACPVRLSPEGEAYVVPAGRSGRVEIRTGVGGGVAWVGRTAFVDIDPSRTVVPVRTEAARPPPAPRPIDVPARWRQAFLLAALVALLLDLLLLVLSRRPADKLAPVPARA